MSAIYPHVNAVMARFAAHHETNLVVYVSDHDLHQESLHLRDTLRLNNCTIAGNSLILHNPPEWCRALLDPPFDNKVFARWLVLFAMDHLDLFGQADNIFWSALESNQVHASASLTSKGLELFFWLPLDKALHPEARFFMQHLLELHSPNEFRWAEEREYDVLEASHEIEFKQRAVSADPRITLTDVQCSTVEWLRTRLDEEGTLLTLFITYQCFGRRFYYSQELGCLTTNKNMRRWTRRCVLLADNMAGKDTAVAVYLHERPNTRSMGAVIICADEVSHAQWCLKLSSQNVQAYIMTYTEVARPSVVIPQAPILILDSAVTFRGIISKCIPLMSFKRVICLTAYTPSVDTAWRLLVPSDDDLVETLWWHSLLENDYLCELWHACVLTHEQVLQQPPRPWITHTLPLQQPVLYEHWKQETLAYYSQLLNPDGGNSEKVLRMAILRMQLGLLGYVEAPEVHYASRQSTVTCSICLEPAARVPMQTACQHTFCAVCLRQWLAQTDTCPLCRSPANPLTLLPVESTTVVRPRVPFVQKQLKLRELLAPVSKAIVISRHPAILESLARSWAAHPTFYSQSEFGAFHRATRGIWFTSLTTLYHNYDVSTPIDLVLCLEPYASTHAVIFSVYRMFTFCPRLPQLAMLACDAEVDAMMPEVNVVGHMWSILQAT